jgi:MraZ protein
MGDLTPSAWTFHGHATPTLDTKGRVTVPARWRHEGMERMVALPDDCQPALRVMPAAVLDRELAKLEADTAQAEELKAEKFRFYSYRAFECPLDKQGRLLLPSAYVERLELGGAVQLVGAFRHFEIWRPEVWQEHFHQLQAAHAAGALRIKQ